MQTVHENSDENRPTMVKTPDWKWQAFSRLWLQTNQVRVAVDQCSHACIERIMDVCISKKVCVL